MKLLELMTLTILSAALSCFGQDAPKAENKASAPVNPPISLSVDFPDTPVRLDSPQIIVNITATNVSGKNIWFAVWRDRNGPYKTFRILLMKNGTEVETTFFHRKMTNRQRPDDPLEVDSGSLFPVEYPQGKMFTVAIDLKRLYEISEPGVYTLDVSRLDDQSKLTIRSKTATLKIDP
jgi:hypothetical protein